MCDTAPSELEYPKKLPIVARTKSFLESPDIGVVGIGSTEIFSELHTQWFLCSSAQAHT